MAEGILSVGNVEILAINDGEVDFPFPLSDIFPSAPAEAWAQYQERYPEEYVGQGLNRPVQTGENQASSSIIAGR